MPGNSSGLKDRWQIVAYSALFSGDYCRRSMQHSPAFLLSWFRPCSGSREAVYMQDNIFSLFLFFLFLFNLFIFILFLFFLSPLYISSLYLLYLIFSFFFLCPLCFCYPLLFSSLLSLLSLLSFCCDWILYQCDLILVLYIPSSFLPWSCVIPPFIPEYFLFLRMVFL